MGKNCEHVECLGAKFQFYRSKYRKRSNCRDVFMNFFNLISNIIMKTGMDGRDIQPTQLFNWSACLSLRDSKCSKWWNSNIIKTCHYEYYLYYFPLLKYTDFFDAWMHPWKNVFTASFGIAYTTCHFQGINQNLSCVRFLKTRQLQVHSPLNFLAIPDWLKC